MTKRAHRDHRAARKVADETPSTGLERLFTVEQIARVGGRCRASLYLDIKAGRLKAIKFGRSTRISESAYRAYVESAPALSPAP
jgi:excisionase family DNA binding protein